MGEGAWGAAVHGGHKELDTTERLHFTSLTSYLSLCLSLNSFCDETSRTRASLGLEGRYHGFCVGLNLSHVGLSSKQRVPAHGLKTQSVVNSFSWAARTKYHGSRGLKTRTNFLTILDSILKSREFTLLTKVYLVKAMIFPVVIYGCES